MDCRRTDYGNVAAYVYDDVITERAADHRDIALTDYLIVIDSQRTLLANQLSLAQAVNLQMVAGTHLIKELGARGQG